MPKKKYTAEFKTKVILTIIQGGQGVQCYLCWLQPEPQHGAQVEAGIPAERPSCIWLRFGAESSSQKGGSPEEKNDQMLKTIGQLTLERNFRQGCFRQIGEAVPSLLDYDLKGL